MRATIQHVTLQTAGKSLYQQLQNAARALGYKLAALTNSEAWWRSMWLCMILCMIWDGIRLRVLRRISTSLGLGTGFAWLSDRHVKKDKVFSILLDI